MIKISSFDGLIDCVGAGNPYPEMQGPVVRQLRCVIGGKVFGIQASYCTDEPPYDIDTLDGVITDDDLLRPFVRNLVMYNRSFVIRQGSSDDMCVLKWEQFQL